MKIKTDKDWQKLNRSFKRWYNNQRPIPQWDEQKQYLSRELINRGYVDNIDIKYMWRLFGQLVNHCSDWRVQSKILFLVIKCLDNNVGEELRKYVK